MRWIAVFLVAMGTFGCSGGTTASDPPTTPTTPPPGTASGGLGRLPDAPIAACAHDRASAQLAPDATPTECHRDADCTDGQNGRCLRLSNHGGHGPSLEASRCSYDACFADADCGERQICVCASRSPGEPGEGHECASSECTTDAECGDGGYCRRTELGNRCHTLDDRCAEETDCGVGMSCSRPSARSPWSCMPFTPPVG